MWRSRRRGSAAADFEGVGDAGVGELFLDSGYHVGGGVVWVGDGVAAGGVEDDERGFPQPCLGDRGLQGGFSFGGWYISDEHAWPVTRSYKKSAPPLRSRSSTGCRRVASTSQGKTSMRPVLNSRTCMPDNIFRPLLTALSGTIQGRD